MIYGAKRDIWRFFVVGGGRGGSRAWCRCSSRAHTHIRARSHTSNGQLAALQGSPPIIVCVCVCVRSHILLDLALERARYERHQRAREHERTRTSCSCSVSLVNSLHSRIICDCSSSDSVLCGRNNDAVELEYRAAAKLDITIGKGPSEQALSCTCCAL